MARHRELPPYCEHALVSRVQAIESVCRGGAGAEAYATPTHTADVPSVRERQVLQLIAVLHPEIPDVVLRL